MLGQKYCGEFLPDGWYHAGRYYCNDQGEMSDDHPGMETLMKNYLMELNDSVGDHNRQVLKEWKDDQIKHE